MGKDAGGENLPDPLQMVADGGGGGQSIRSATKLGVRFWNWIWKGRGVEEDLQGGCLLSCLERSVGSQETAFS